MTTLRLLVGYDGGGFAGFQSQPGQRTVQGVIEDALERLAGAPIRVRAAGRTDAGVHALGQVVSFDDDRLDPDMVLRALAGCLPEDVSVFDVQAGPDGFDARASARGRTYVYLLWPHASRHPLYGRYSWWLRGGLDVRLLREALAVVEGTHDFSSFARVRTDQSPERTVLEASCEADDGFVRVRVTGLAFLHQMVRSIVGSAVEVAAGRRDLAWMRDALAARDRGAAGPVAPPEGLTLTDVVYDAVPWPRRPALTWPWLGTPAAGTQTQAFGGGRR